MTVPSCDRSKLFYFFKRKKSILENTKVAGIPTNRFLFSFKQKSPKVKKSSFSRSCGQISFIVFLRTKRSNESKDDEREKLPLGSREKCGPFSFPRIITATSSFWEVNLQELFLSKRKKRTQVSHAGGNKSTTPTRSFYMKSKKEFVGN